MCKTPHSRALIPFKQLPSVLLYDSNPKMTSTLTTWSMSNMYDVKTFLLMVNSEQTSPVQYSNSYNMSWYYFVLFFVNKPHTLTQRQLSSHTVEAGVYESHEVWGLFFFSLGIAEDGEIPNVKVCFLLFPLTATHTYTVRETHTHIDTKPHSLTGNFRAIKLRQTQPTYTTVPSKTFTHFGLFQPQIFYIWC